MLLRSTPTEKAKNYCGCCDNGKGITANRLEEIRERLNQTEIETEQSIGLRNVHERLQRFWGELWFNH